MKNGVLFAKIILGNLLLAFGVNMFIIPFNFISGGSTGLALIITHFINIPFTAVVTGINIIMFITGYFILGKRFAFTTLLSTIIYPFLIEMTASVSSMFTLTHDPLVATIVCGTVFGTGLGLVIQSGASTGGLDIPPLVVEKLLHVPVSVAMYVMDTCLLLTQMTFSSLEGILCGCLLVFITSFVMNQILTFGKSACQVMIMTEKFEEMRQAFLVDLNRGVTMFMVETGYYQKDQKALCSIISRQDLHAVQKKVLEVDPQAFMIVSKVHEVRGLGFKSLDKVNILH